jgi:hypothetical protein
VEALFKVLTGKIKPTGRLPVQIRNLFPRGFAWEEQWPQKSTKDTKEK